MKPTKPQDIQGLANIPPNALEMEQAVLGAILLEKKAMYLVKDKLFTDVFYKDQHRAIWEAISSMHDSGEPIDLLTVSNRLRAMGTLEKAGSTYYLAELTSRVASSANIEVHASIIVEQYLKREIAFELPSIGRMAFDDTVELDELYQKIDELRELYRNIHIRMAGVKCTDLKEAYLEQIKRMNAQIASNVPYGLLVGKKFLDDYLGAIEPGLVIIAARPSMGKTTFGMWLATEFSNNGHPGAFIGLELGQIPIIRRFMARLAGISLDYIKNPKRITQQEWERINGAKIPNGLMLPKIDNTQVNYICMEIEHLVKKGAKYIVIDQLNFILPDPRKKANTKNDEVGNITRVLAQLAIKLDIPIILLHQLNREAVKSDLPELHHLRDSGNIEQDARVVIFLDVPYKRGIKQMDDGSSSDNKAVIKIAKNGESEAPLISIAKYYPSMFTYDDDIPELYFVPKIDFQPSVKHSDIMPF